MNFHILLLMEELPNNHLEFKNQPVNNAINYQPQLVNARFLNQQYHPNATAMPSTLHFNGRVRGDFFTWTSRKKSR